VRRLFRLLRIFVLLATLAIVAASTWLTRLRTTDWDAALWVVIYPINGDGRPTTAAYIRSLTRRRFAALEQFFADEARAWEVDIDTPLRVELAPEVDTLPPPPPADPAPWRVMPWSLHLRWWAWRADNFPGPAPDIRVFVVYHDPTHVRRLAHSLGLEKGLIGVVNAFAGRRHAETNNVVIAHEILHTLGATDKYLPGGQPRWPDGYAEPAREPRHPQRFAEIMGGRIPVSASRAVMPPTLHHCVVGEATAREIRWLRD